MIYRAKHKIDIEARIGYFYPDHEGVKGCIEYELFFIINGNSCPCPIEMYSNEQIYREVLEYAYECYYQTGDCYDLQK